VEDIDRTIGRISDNCKELLKKEGKRRKKWSSNLI
jgi:predicted nucleic acid-binding Zn ribbon protein